MKRTKKKSNLPAKKKEHHNSVWKEEYPVKVFQLAKMGKTNAEIATALGVGIQTVNRWRQVRDSFGIALKTGRWIHNTTEVESALLKKALGYDYQEITTEEVIIYVDGEEKSHVVKTETVTDDKGKQQKKISLVPGIKRKITHKHIAPDVGALCFFLCNRAPDEWRNVQSTRIESTGKVTHEHKHELDLTKLNRGQLEQLREIVAKATAIEASESTGSGLRISAG